METLGHCGSLYPPRRLALLRADGMAPASSHATISDLQVRSKEVICANSGNCRRIVCRSSCTTKAPNCCQASSTITNCHHFPVSTSSLSNTPPPIPLCVIVPRTRSSKGWAACSKTPYRSNLSECGTKKGLGARRTRWRFRCMNGGFAVVQFVLRKRCERASISLLAARRNIPG